MRSTSQCLPLAVLAMLAAGCDQPTAPNGPPALALAVPTPNASISDAANGGRLGFYFLPSLVANPGTFDGTFDGTLQPYGMICQFANASGCGDNENVMVFPFGGDKPAGISVDALKQTYSATWNKPTLGVGKYRLTVAVNVTAFGLSRQIGLGFVDLQVIAKKKDPVDAGLVGVVKGSPIPLKFRIENGVVGGIEFTTLYNVVDIGSEYVIYSLVFDLHGHPAECPNPTFTSSNPTVVSITPTGIFHPVSVGDATITVTCRGVSRTMALTVLPPVPDEP